MKDEILEYIQKHVTEWPEGAVNVRLDDDGEICFYTEKGCCSYDFYPEHELTGVNSKKYTREEWEKPVKTIMDAVNALKGDLSNDDSYSGDESHIYYSRSDEVFITCYMVNFEGAGSLTVFTIEEFNTIISQLETNFGESIAYSKYKERFARGFYGHRKIKVNPDDVKGINKPKPVYTKEFKVRGGNTCDAVYQPCRVAYKGTKFTVLVNENGREFSRRTAKLDIRDIDTRTEKEKAIDEYIKSRHHGMDSLSQSIKTIMKDAFEAGVKWVGK